ncbi:MAG: HEAT repeat domain-containing protein [Planctomycetota bacterium]
MSRIHARTLVALVSLVALGACGDDAPEESGGSLETYETRESKTLKEEGSPLSDAEKTRREEQKRAERETFEQTKEAQRAKSELAKAEDDFDRAEIVAKIARLGVKGEPLLPDLEALLTSEDETLRAQVYRAIAAIQGTKSSGILRRSFEDDSDSVRAAGLVAWKKAGITDLEPAWRMLDPLQASDVQLAALDLVLSAESLEGTRDRLALLLPQMDPAAARRGMKDLAEHADEISDPRGFGMAMLDHHDEVTRVQAIKFLGSRNDKPVTVADKLVRCLGDDPDEQVRAEAHRLLMAWVGTESPPTYDPAAEDGVLMEAAAAWRTWFEDNRAKFDA